MPDGATGAESARVEKCSEEQTGQEHEQPPDVTCSGGFKLPSISAFMPTGDQLAAILGKAQADGE